MSQNKAYPIKIDNLQNDLTAMSNRYVNETLTNNSLPTSRVMSRGVNLEEVQRINKRHRVEIVENSVPMKDIYSQNSIYKLYRAIVNLEIELDKLSKNTKMYSQDSLVDIMNRVDIDEGKIETLTVNINKLSTEISTLIENSPVIADMKTNIETLNAHDAQFTKNLTKLNETYKEFYELVNAGFSSRDTRFQNHLTDYVSLKQKNTTHEKRLNGIDTSINNTNVKLNTFISDVSLPELRNDMNKLKQRIASSEQRDTNLDSNINSLATQLNAYKNDVNITALRTEISNIKYKNEVQDQTLQNLNEDIDNVSFIVQEFKRDVNMQQIRTEINDIKTRLSRCEETISTLNTDLDDFAFQLQDFIKAVDITQLKYDIASLKRSISG